MCKRWCHHRYIALVRVTRARGDGVKTKMGVKMCFPALQGELQQKAGGDGSGGSGSQDSTKDGGTGASGDEIWCPAGGGAGPQVAAGGIRGREESGGDGGGDGGGGGGDGGSAGGGGGGARRSLQSGLVRAAAPHPRHGANDFGERADPAASAKSHFEITFYFHRLRQVPLRNYFLLFRLETDLTNLPPQDGRKGRGVPILADRRRTAAPRPWVGQNETDPKGPDLDTPHTPNARGGAIIPYRNRVKPASGAGREKVLPHRQLRHGGVSAARTGLPKR